MCIRAFWTPRKKCALFMTSSFIERQNSSLPLNGRLLSKKYMSPGNAPRRQKKTGQGFVRKLRTGILNSGFLFYGGNKNLSPLFIRVSRRRGHFYYYFIRLFILFRKTTIR